MPTIYSNQVSQSVSTNSLVRKYFQKICYETCFEIIHSNIGCREILRICLLSYQNMCVSSPFKLCMHFFLLKWDERNSKYTVTKFLNASLWIVLFFTPSFSPFFFWEIYWKKSQVVFIPEGKSFMNSTPFVTFHNIWIFYYSFLNLYTISMMYDKNNKFH